MTTTSDREILITRLINAPRERVWQAWSNLDALSQWWGPNGFTTTTEEFDFSVGGKWKFIMHGPDGRDYPNLVVFTEIVPFDRICNDHGADDGKVQFQAVITFEEQNGKTLVTMKSIFPSKEERDFVVKEVGAIEGGKQTLGRLDLYISKTSD